MKWPVAAVLVALGVSPAVAGDDQPKLPAGYSCDDVRRVVADMGRVKALALAIEAGATWSQIREAKRCLK